jgi:hypothetical protein
MNDSKNYLRTLAWLIVLFTCNAVFAQPPQTDKNIIPADPIIIQPKNPSQETMDRGFRPHNPEAPPPIETPQLNQQPPSQPQGPNLEWDYKNQQVVPAEH